MARAAWRRDLIWGALVLTVSLLFGVLLDAVLPCLALALIYLLGRSYWYLWNLSRWVQRPKQHELPEIGGLWGEVFERLIERQRSDRKRKKRLTLILSEFQASTAALPDGAVVLTPRGEIAWFNKSAQALLGLRTPQDVGQRIPNLIRHPDFTGYYGRGDYDRPVELPSPINTAVTLSLRIIPYGNRQLLLIVRDVSEIRRAETARRDFVANASHELRTPLTVLRGYLDMMGPEAGANGSLSAWSKPVDEMRRQAARMESLIADMLKLARLESGVIQHRQQVVDMVALAEAAAESGRGLSRGRHEIVVEADAALRLYGRETELRSVIDNLVSNAIHYSPDGGRVAVSWHGSPDGASLRVSDTGLGIDEADVDRITERFFRVDAGRSREQGGTGLGLAIVKHVLDCHEGWLDIHSKPGEGSSFICYFPEHRVHRAAPLAASG